MTREIKILFCIVAATVVGSCVLRNHIYQSASGIPLDPRCPTCNGPVYFIGDQAFCKKCSTGVETRSLARPATP